MRHIPKPLTHASILVNRLIGGEKDMSLCAAFYKSKCKGSVVGKVGVYLIDKLFFWDNNHCRKAFLLRGKK